jgi:hypothetical protein
MAYGIAGRHRESAALYEEMIANRDQLDIRSAEAVAIAHLRLGEEERAAAVLRKAGLNAAEASERVARLRRAVR